MDKLSQYTLYLHILVGGVALITGAIAIGTKKGKKWHRAAGRIYFWAMTLVFVTGIMVAYYQFNRFLFLIAFLSYYTVFTGVRFLKLKQLHKTQSPKWYDWMAGILNGLANLIFVCYGLYLFLINGLKGGTLLSLGFGMGGLFLTYTNVKPFIVKPTRANHWYTAHIGNMMGGYIATFTAFLSTMVSRYQFMNPYLAFALPALIGVPLLIYWTWREEQKYDEKRNLKPKNVTQ
ncbi:DUF2306 domain-containing protein [Cytophagales bacterium LB-30]|uniref:DUF2306 domain-containing protein n=1 Tax=Shiella aurantiaca TaxID=3058365 RepID=A0ABT8F978_9BACT|nr:DUF2306 domain-containing protein [Shiella aurantiaca]MDN4166982.1 DUF2306 domain-containing protein [Shiella aurantiaca]